MILLVTAVGTAGVAGCGGGGDDEAPAPTAVTGTTDVAAITKDELIDQGDSLCSEVNSAVGTIDSSTTADDSIKQSQIAGIYSGLAEHLQDLGTPSDGEAPTDVIEAAQALAESTDADGAAALATFQSTADDYGFTECGEAPAAPSSSSSSSSDGSTDAPSDSGSSGGYVAPTTPAPSEPAPAPVTPAPPSGNGGGVVPSTPPDSGSGGGSSSGGISPG